MMYFNVIVFYKTVFEFILIRICIYVRVNLVIYSYPGYGLETGTFGSHVTESLAYGGGSIQQPTQHMWPTSQRFVSRYIHMTKVWQCKQNNSERLRQSDFFKCHLVFRFLG